MDSLIKENLESLLQETSNTKRLGRRIISLAGFLSPSEPLFALQLLELAIVFKSGLDHYR